MSKEDEPQSGSVKREEQADKPEGAAPQDEATVEFPATEDPTVDTKREELDRKEKN